MRYLDVVVQSAGRYVVDFNRAYNPACVFSPHYNCPIPPPENRLSVAIRAGERMPKGINPPTRHLRQTHLFSRCAKL